jgi:hypothetical protein
MARALALGARGSGFESRVPDQKICVRAVAQLVARIVRVDEAVGSSPTSPTKREDLEYIELFFFCLR